MQLPNDISKVNLGCGDSPDKIFPRPWLNVDINSPYSDFKCDARKLPEEWSERFFEVRASHILEHCFLNEWESIIREWVRILRPGGIFRVVVPDIDIVMKCLQAGVDMKGRQALSITDTTAVLAQIFGIGYDSADTDERWRHRMVINGPFLSSFLEKLGLFSKVLIYQRTEDAAALNNIKDDSQNPFSIHIVAIKKIVVAEHLQSKVINNDIWSIKNNVGQKLYFNSGENWEPVNAEQSIDISYSTDCKKFARAFLLLEECEELNHIIHQGN